MAINDKNKMNKSDLDKEAADYDLVDDDCPNKRTHFYEFKEYETVMKLLNNLPNSIKELRDREKSFEQFLYICDAYQEQPHLIDPFLTEIIDKLIDLVKSSMKADLNEMKEHDELLINESFKYMHALTKMRGYKKIVQHLPHEITDFEPVLNLLARQDMKDVYTWQTRYVLLLWLSIVCMVPFDLNRFDANTENKDDSIMNRLLKTCIVRHTFNFILFQSIPNF